MLRSVCCCIYISYPCFVLKASEPLTTVFKYITYSFMIDNVVLIMAGAVQSRSFAVCYLVVQVEHLTLKRE